MLINEIHLSLFKGFRDYKLSLSPFTVLVGHNNGGKTTILQAVRFLYEIVRFAFGNTDAPNFSNPHWQASPSDRINTLTLDPDALWLEKRATEPCEIVAKLNTGLEIHLKIAAPTAHELDILVDGVSIRSSISDHTRVVQEFLSFGPEHVPSIGAISPVEPLIRSYPALRRQIEQGKLAQNWRSYLYWLWNDDLQKPDFDTVVSRVQEQLPGITVTPPRLSHENDPLVEVRFEEDGLSLDINASGGGLRSLLNIAVLLTFARDRCLMFHEPDAHLHGALQTSIAQMLTQYAVENETQVIVATHGPDFIAACPVDALVWVDTQLREGRRCSDLGRTLADLGSITKADAARAYGANKILFVEGSLDQNVLRQLFGLSRRKNPFDYGSVIVANLPGGKGDQYHVEMFKKMLLETHRMKVSIACITDNDYGMIGTNESRIEGEMDGSRCAWGGRK